MHMLFCSFSIVGIHYISFHRSVSESEMEKQFSSLENISAVFFFETGAFFTFTGSNRCRFKLLFVALVLLLKLPQAFVFPPCQFKFLSQDKGVGEFRKDLCKD